MEFRQLEKNDIASLKDLFINAGLNKNHLDVDLNTSVVCQCCNDIIGFAGIEVYGDIAVGNNLLVHSSFRERGIGKKLIKDLSRVALSMGVKSVYMATDNAEFYFRGQGMSVITAQDLPSSLDENVIDKLLADGKCLLKAEIIQEK